MTSRRGVIGSLSTAALALVLPRAAAGRRAHGLLETAPDGIPYRASIDPQSAYYWDSPAVWAAIIEIDGEKPQRCVEFDRREGWVLCDSENSLKVLPRRYGHVKVWIP